MEPQASTDNRGEDLWNESFDKNDYWNPKVMDQVKILKIQAHL